MTGEMTPELQTAIDDYNDNLINIAQKILSLKINNVSEIEVKHLWNLFDEMSVINNIKSRRTTEKLLEKIINEYGIILQDYRDQGEENNEFTKDK